MFFSEVQKMYVKDVINKCKERGYEITKMGLYTAGKKYGFISKADNKHSLEFNKDKFLEWLDKATEEIPAGWLSVKQIAEKFEISITQAYLLVKDENSGARTIGSGVGVIYVDPKRIEQIIKKRQDSHKENWGDENGTN